MSGEVEKLESLLSRVQENRHHPRPAGPAAGPAPVAVAPVASKLNRASSPLELAVAGEIDRTQAGGVAAPVMPQPAPAPAVVPAPAPVRAAPVAASPEGGVLLAEPPAPVPTRPVAQLVSNHTAPSSLSFGELLKRSLALRPR